VCGAGYSGVTGGVKGRDRVREGVERGLERDREREGVKRSLEQRKPVRTMVIYNKIKQTEAGASLSNCTHYQTHLSPTTCNNPIG